MIDPQPDIHPAFKLRVNTNCAEELDWNNLKSTNKNQSDYWKVIKKKKRETFSEPSGNSFTLSRVNWHSVCKRIKCNAHFKILFKILFKDTVLKRWQSPKILPSVWQVTQWCQRITERLEGSSGSHPVQPLLKQGKQQSGSDFLKGWKLPIPKLFCKS